MPVDEATDAAAEATSDADTASDAAPPSSDAPEQGTIPEQGAATEQQSAAAGQQPAADAPADAPAPSPAAGGGIAPYDFRRPTKLSREGGRLLQLTFETFARRLGTVLTSSLRQVCSVEFHDVGQQTYDEYIANRPTPTVMVPIGLPRLNTTGVMQFSLPVALTAIDHMLGGPGGEQPERSLTDIETTLLGTLLDQMIDVFGYVMEPLAALKPKLGPLEYNPQFVQVIAGTDATLVASLTMAIGNESTDLTLCLPLAPLLPLIKAHREQAGAGVEDDGASQEARHVATNLNDTAVTTTVEFSPTSMTPTDVLHLAVGDVITLPHRVGSPLAVKVGDMTYANAIAGRAGSRLAARITTTIKEQA